MLAVAAGKTCSFTLSAMSRQGKDRPSGKISVLPLRNLHLRKNLHIHHGITTRVLTCVAGLFPQQELCTGPYYKQRACLEVPGACNACKTTCLYDISDCGRLCRGKRQDSFPSGELCSRSSTLQRCNLQLKYVMLLSHLSGNAHVVQSVLAVGGKSKLNWRVQDGCGASFQVCNSGIVASSTSTKKVSECRYLGLPFREEDRKWSPKPGSL